MCGGLEIIAARVSEIGNLALAPLIVASLVWRGHDACLCLPLSKQRLGHPAITVGIEDSFDGMQDTTGDLDG